MPLDPIAQVMALAAARQEPNSFLRTQLLRRLATPGHWQVEEAGLYGSVAHDEGGDTHQTPLALVGQSEADKYYIAALHNVHPRLLGELARMAAILRQLAFVPYGEEPPFKTIYEMAAFIQASYPDSDGLEAIERLPAS